MKKLILFFVVILLPMFAYADAVEIDGIYYNLITKDGTNSAEVTQNPNYYSGNIVIPESVTYNNVTYSVTSIGGRAFYSCSNLTSVTIPNIVTSIGQNAFYGCTNLATIEIPNSVTYIEQEAFIGCTSLTSVSIPNSVTSIGQAAFSGCTSLSSIEIPNSITTIQKSLFEKCSALASVTLPNSVITIGRRAFVSCTSLSSITIPNSVTTIGEGAFAGDPFKTLTIPDNVTSIGGSAFRYCKELTSVVIGKSVTEIGQSAFEYCDKISQITIYAENPPYHGYTPDDTFHGVDHTIPVYVPAGCVLKYKASKLFGDFVIIREIGDMDKDIYLTINDGEHGSVKLKMDKSNPYATLKFEAVSGWKVYNVTLNGESVKDYIDAEGNYTTPAINSNSILNIVYTEESTDINSFQTSDLQFSTSANTVIVNGTRGGEHINVYTLDGKCVESLRANHAQTTISLENNQTYIVKIDKNVFKIRL